MKKIIVIVVLAMLLGCAGRQPLSPEMQRVSSVVDTHNCIFIRAMYMEIMFQHTLTYYLSRNVYNAGGDSYKIISTKTDRVFGTDITGINFEIYKCK